MGLSELAPGWEVVQLAAMNAKGSLFGRVRANKILSFLQLAGYPIPIRFRIIQMGPASPEVDTRAAAAQETGLLEVHQMKTDYQFDRVDYQVTPAGREYVATQLMPTLQGHPSGDLFMGVLQDTVEDRLYGRQDDLVNEIHRRLHLDDRDELVNTYTSIRRRLEAHSDEFADRPLRDRVDLAAAGAVDFAVVGLQASQPLLNDPDYHEAGAYHIVANAATLAGMVEPLQAMHTDHKRDRSIARRFDRILNALEWNAALYDIVDVPTDEEIATIISEGGPYDPDLGTL